ncbi:MAG TPA: branched-chain amino acid ABC transporter ATP-binding protein/permease [Acidimicrobiales bacterium]|jgi:branched-chain amino acid transport system permease protein|nr:branched-chain amino acid ABC transporter ATP-binding protein/permease [Acidimicrobiales bacterium]
MAVSDGSGTIERVAHVADPRRAALWDRVRPPLNRGVPYIRIALVLVVMVLYRNLRTEGRAQEALFNDWLTYAIVVLGFYFVFGLAGQFAFSQAAMFGLGAYASAWATHNPDHPFTFGPIAAIILVLGIALVFSIIMQRTEHFYFAVGTLGLQNIVILVITKWKGFTHGSGGEALNIRPISWFGTKFVTEFQVFKFLAGALAVFLVIAAFIERSPVRRESIANRDKPVVARTLGLPTLTNRVTMFMLGSFFAALAGSFYAHRSSTVTPESFGVSLGLFVFLMAIVGGIGSMWGALIGSWFYVYANEKITTTKTSLFDHELREFRPIIFGIILILVMIVLPDGIVGVGARLRRLFRRDGRPILPNWLALMLGLARPPRPAATADDEVRAVANLPGRNTPRPTPGPPVLEAEHLTVSFGGVRAVDDITITLHEREILGLIGPNGSGKSTAVNAITGVVPAGGSVRLGGHAVTLGRPGTVRRAGVLRTYQTPQTFLHMSCIENVLLTTTDRRLTGIVSSTLLRPLMLRRERQRWRNAAAALDRVGLLERAEESAANLSYGQQRLLELARVIAGAPSVVLLDEPSAGLNVAETDLLAGHLRQLRQEGMSLLVIDHKIDFIDQLVDRVIVLELGHLVAEGDPQTIWDDPRVQNAYLGMVHDDDTTVA